MKRRALSPGTRFTVWQRDGFCCTYCGADAVTALVVLEVDHIIPVSAGGGDLLSNLTTACRPCNWGKGPRPQRSSVRLIQTTVLLDPGQEAEIRRLCVAWGDASLASVVRRLLGEALTARREQAAVEMAV